MRFRTLALALALCFGLGSTAMVQAAPAKQKPFKLKKPKKVKQNKASKRVVSKASKVKPRKAKKSRSVHKG